MIRGHLAEPIEGKQHIPMKLMTNTHSAQSICQGFFFFFISKWQKLFRSLLLFLVPEHCLFFFIVISSLNSQRQVIFSWEDTSCSATKYCHSLISRCDNFNIALTSSVLPQWSLAGMAKRNETTQRNHRLPSDTNELQSVILMANSNPKLFLCNIFSILS